MMESRDLLIEKEKTPFDLQAIKDLLTAELKIVIDYRAKQPQQDSLKDHQTFLTYVLGPTLFNKYHVKPKNLLQVANIRTITDATKKMLSEHSAIFIKIIHILKSTSLSEFDYIQMYLLLGLVISQKIGLFKLIENTTGINPGSQYLLDGNNIWSMRDVIQPQLSSAYEIFNPMITVIENDDSQHIYVDWQKWRVSIYDKLDELDGLIEGDVVESIFTEKRREFLNFLTNTLVKIHPADGKIIMLDVNNITLIVSQFEKLYPTFKEHYNYLYTRQIHISYYKQRKCDIDTKLIELDAKYLTVKNMVKKIKPLKQALSNEYRELRSLTDALWPENYPEKLAGDLTTEKTIDFISSKSMTRIDVFIAKLNATEQKLLVGQEKHQQTMMMAEENKLLAASNEATFFKQQQAQKQKQFEDEVASKRKEKLLLEPSNIQNQTLSSTTVDKGMQSTTYINNDFVLMYRKLSRNKKELLKAVLNSAYGLRYQKILSLFKKLGVTIEEIGNGSSHKRLKMPQVEMTIMQDLDTPKEAPMVTGGLFRPGEPTIPQAGLELINDLFSKAGITLSLIELLESEDIAVNNNNAKAEVSELEAKQNSRKL